MLLTYGITVVIIGAWILKMIEEKMLIFKRTPLDLALLLFLGANILSTIFSMDTHISIWGYYSRSNGGLLSIISYLLLYWAFVSNMSKEKVLTTLKFALASGVVVSVYGILEHFGVSPSCVILRNQFNADCWVQDVQARVFATLGQPNWMAGYLAMLIFPALYFYLTAVTRTIHISYYTLILIFYLGFTFTYSRGPTLGLIAGMVVFLFFYFLKESLAKSKPLVIILVSFLAVNILFGSALTSFRLVSKFAPPPRPTLSLPTTSVTQLENGGTESGQIRFIVWQGALDIFKHYPILGSGLETFAYSYYQFRPASHNLTSEWDFLYNKAHNEYLNYLATTGIVGFGAYMLVIGTFILWSIRKILNSKSDNLLLVSLLAGLFSYLIYNFFLFSVVILALLFYLFPALAFVATDSTKVYSLKVFSLVYKRSLYTKFAQGLVIFFTLYLLYSVFQLWLADTIFNKGQNASDAGNPGRAYNYLIVASELKKSEPFFHSELAYNAASAALAIEETDATLSAKLKDQAKFEMEKVLKGSPNNVSYLRTAVRTYFELSLLDESFTQKTLDVLDKAILLAPTDPKLYYNKALILESQGKKQEQIEALQKAFSLKPNYLEVKAALEEATKSAEKP